MAVWRDWYDKLNKPTWTPPPRTISTIWTILYPIIFISYGFVFYEIFRKEFSAILAVPFVINLVANFAFTPILFNLKNLRLAAADILVVWLTIVWTIVVIWPHSHWVAIAQIPYLAWVSTATTLQLQITRRN